MKIATDPREISDAVTRIKVVNGTAKQEGRTFVLLYTEDVELVLKRLAELENDCQQLLS